MDALTEDDACDVKKPRISRLDVARLEGNVRAVRAFDSEASAVPDVVDGTAERPGGERDGTFVLFPVKEVHAVISMQLKAPNAPPAAHEHTRAALRQVANENAWPLTMTHVHFSMNEVA